MCSVLGIRDWDGAPRRVHAARETSRRDRCGIKKTRRGRVFLMALRETCPETYFHETCPGGLSQNMPKKFMPGKYAQKSMPGKCCQITHFRGTCHIR